MGTADGAGWAGNLPVEATTFVGRHRDLAEVERLLTAARLVMLTGFGGVGKSRLALRVATGQRRAFEHGVWWVELAGVGDPELVAHTVASTLRIGEQSGRAPLAALVDFVRNRRLLLVLDNCEHLSDACALLADTLLAQAPGVTILATSRRSLGLVGEYVWPVAPLAVPDPDGQLPARALERFPALELFVERAAAVRPGFAMAEEDLRNAARICHRLDGIPLGIELSAVWLRTLGISEVAARLDDRFGPMTATNRAVPPRHKTLRAAVQWSYELCSRPEQLLWTRVSTFAGGFDPAAAEAVCAGGDLPPDKVPATLDALVDKSILLCDPRSGQPRYRLLETLREYGLERLREAGDEEALRRRHRNHYWELARRCDAEWFGPHQLDWFARLRAEHANLRAALDFCMTHPGEGRAGQSLAAALWFYWLACGQLREGRYWLDRALAQDLQPSRERAAALAINGYVTVMQADLDAGDAMLAESLTLAGQLGDDSTYCRAAVVSSIAAFHRMDVPRALRMQELADARFASLAVPDGFEPVARVSSALQYAMGIDPVRGVELCEQCCQASEDHSELWTLSWADFGLANAAWLQGRADEATRHGRRCLWGKWRFADALGIAVTVELLAWIAAAAGDCERAAVLLGASRRTFQHFGLPVFVSAHFVEPQRVCEDTARSGLGDTGFEAALRRGAGFTLEEAVAYALGVESLDAVPVAAHGTTGGAAGGHDADLVADDLSDQQIASRLMIAERQRDQADLMRREGFELSAILDPDQVIERLAGMLIRAVGADAALLVCAEAGGFAAAAIGTGCEAAKRELDGRDGPALEAMVASTTTTRGPVERLPQSLAGLVDGARHWLAIPLASRTHHAGLLVLASNLVEYEESQAKLAATLSSQAMIARDNALLFQRVEQLATVDGLSGLNNRRYFFELAGHQVAIAVRKNRPISVAMLDIDNFKWVNDTHGHAVGDEVIQTVAGRIVDCVRAIDIVGRYGGEEFAILLPETGKDVELVAERLRTSISATAVGTAVGPLPITISVGTAVRDLPDESLDALLERADRALYQAKQAGRNRVEHG